MDPFLERLDQVIRKESLLPRRGRILVAVSGGLDSMALLSALFHLRGAFGWQLEVAHFNHHLRGRASDADERLVRRQCAAFKLRCHVGHWTAKIRGAAIRAGGVEHAARSARRAFLGRTAARRRITLVALAHHADDQVEHFFVRLLRGAGSQGLGGMRKRVKHGAPLHAWLVRPLLDFTRADLATWAAGRKLKFREDASNRDARFLRNRVRHELLPFLNEQFSPVSGRLILRTMKNLADEADWLRAAAADYLRTPATKRQRFADCPTALQRHALVQQLEARRLQFDWELIENLRTRVNTTITGPGNHELARDQFGNLSVERPRRTSLVVRTRTIDVTAARGGFEFASLAVRWARQRRVKPDRFLPQQELFDAATVGDTIQLRFWKPGDRFQPIGMYHAVKLQDLFTNAKVPTAERHQRAVATTVDGELFWVEGLRIGERFKLTPATRTCLGWQWQRRSGPGRQPASSSRKKSRNQ